MDEYIHLDDLLNLLRGLFSARILGHNFDSTCIVSYHSNNMSVIMFTQRPKRRNTERNSDQNCDIFFCFSDKC